MGVVHIWLKLEVIAKLPNTATVVILLSTLRVHLASGDFSDTEVLSFRSVTAKCFSHEEWVRGAPY